MAKERPLLVLGIETATPVTSVAVGSDDGTLAAASVASARGHARHLMSAVDWALEHSGVRPAELSAVAVGIGPGLFTGLRVGVSTAKALAQAWQLPVVPVFSLEVLAFGYRDAAPTVCAVIDARRGEVFACWYRVQDGDVRPIGDDPAGGGAGEPEVLEPGRLLARIGARNEPVLVVGDGVLAVGAAVAAAGKHAAPAGSRIAAPAAPCAEALVALAVRRLRAPGAAVQPLAVSPVYLRRADADPGWERRLATLRAGHRAAGASAGQAVAAGRAGS